MKPFILAGVLLAGSAAYAQGHEGHDMGNMSMEGMAQPQPAAASSAASMAGYSAEERASGLREGRGMGLAMPAERNGYPGPRHVLELADRIGLSAEQRARTQSLFDAMQSQARRLGAQLLAQEAELDAMFRAHRATPASLEATARRIGETEAALKVTHLRTHLAMVDVLTPDQLQLYVAARRAGGGSGRTRPAGDTPASPSHAE
jgi:Spy/CpxP family protein refolding chaperone